MKRLKYILIAVTILLSIGCVSVNADTSDEIIAAYTNILKSSQYQDDGKQECRFIIYDIDKDGIPELFIDTGTCEADRKLYIYTFENGQAKLIGDRVSSHSSFASIPDKNGIMIITAHSSRQYAGIISVVDGALDEKDFFSKYLTPEEYIAHNDGYYTPDELYSGSKELKLIDDNNISAGLEQYKANAPISVEINNKKIQFDVPPQIINDRTMVPMRAIFEELGYTVDWSQATQSITAVRDVDTIFMKIGSTNMYYNEKLIELDSIPTIINDRTLVPVRAISEASGYDVQWDNDEHRVIIENTKPKDREITTAEAIDKATEYFECGAAIVYDSDEQYFYVRAFHYYNKLLDSYIGPVGECCINKYTGELTESGKKSVTSNSSFYNASSEVDKVKEYINSGLYLEAINLCDFVTENYNLSDDDKNKFSSLKQEAQTKYDEYSSEQSKWKEYYYDDWCIGFTGLASYKPTYFKGGDHIQVYNSGGNTINITSYKIGTIGSSGKLTSNINECAKMFQTIIDYSSDSIEIISETDTTAGALNAYQRTYRITEYTNRYQTKADYKIIRHIVFKYGDWIYLIEAEQPQYIWDDDFYNLMEKVRTSISFY